MLLLVFALGIGTTVCSAQTKVQSYQTAPSLNSRMVDGVSFTKYRTALTTFCNYIKEESINKNKSYFIDVPGLKGTDIVEKILKEAQNIGTATLNADGTISLILSTEKYTEEDIAHALLWKNGLR